jgi:hypothetical protein
MIRLLAAVLLFLPYVASAQQVSDPVSRSAPFRFLTSDVASLPACTAGATNDVRMVTNALSPVKGATVSGGGAVFQLVVCNVSVWQVL